MFLSTCRCSAADDHLVLVGPPPDADGCGAFLKVDPTPPRAGGGCQPSQQLEPITCLFLAFRPPSSFFDSLSFTRAWCDFPTHSPVVDLGGRVQFYFDGAVSSPHSFACASLPFFLIVRSDCFSVFIPSPIFFTQALRGLPASSPC